MNKAEFIEPKSHGTADFPIEYYHLNSEHPRYNMAAHWHKEFEIIRVLRGSFTVFLNNVKYRLNEGDVLFAEGGKLHRGIPSDCVYECLVFNPDMLIRHKNDVARRYIKPISDMQVTVENQLNKTHQKLYATVCSLFDVMREKKQFYELKTISLLYEFFICLYENGYVSALPTNKTSQSIKSIMTLTDWIENNLSEPITLDLLSKKAGLSKKYLCRVFKSYTSKTLTQYVNELRINNACYEMSAMNKNITEAAYDSGFNDLSYFCKVFKKIRGETPTEYKSNR